MYPTTMGAERNTITTRRALITRMTQKLLNRSLTKETPAVPTTPIAPIAPVKRSLLFFLLALDRARPHLGPAAHEREVLAEGMALEGLRQHQLHQVGMALEHHAEQLGGLPLVPVRPRVQVRQGGAARLVPG